MPTPRKPIRARRGPRGTYLITYAEAPEKSHTSPIPNDEGEAAALQWARRNRERFLAAPAAPLRFAPFLTGFFDSDGGWARREREKGRSLGERVLALRRGHVANYLLPIFGEDDPRTLLGREIDDRLLVAPRAAGGAPLAPGTRRKIAESLSLVYDDLVERGIVAVNPLARIRRFSKRPVAPRGIIPAAALARLFPPTHGGLVRTWSGGDAHSGYTGGALWGAMMLVFYDTGMRPTEAARLRWSDLEREEDEDGVLWSLVFQGAKGGPLRAVGISARTAQELAIWRAETRYPGDEDYIFTFSGAPVDDASVLKAFRRGLEAVGLAGERWTTYWLRHSWVTEAMAALTDQEVALLAGHSVEVSRAVYQHPTREIALARSRAAREKLDRARQG